ncbi:hypothetical protein [Gloeocapsa sp. PCC 73106]|uniref:hypothetical protein n=1 Tax=Gloeocapsa sp. PCC 73106 TaxID=102232 RepID=UPI0002ACDC22|nr:hypothetical protein [Gloeocapsa sp. PCC 73106]ELR96461.1 hypothetical protein GLO73106DRAFT_00002550 [Gloeocapsa sp. PCC 73106]
MNTLEMWTKINQKIALLSPEQLNSVWKFLESLESPILNNNPSSQTVLEKMGGYPESLLESQGNLSDRDVRQQIITEQIHKKHQSRHQ